MPLINNYAGDPYRTLKAQEQNYRRRFHELLAADNGLEQHRLYNILHNMPVTEGEYYVVYFLGSGGFMKIGYAQDLFNYWVNMLLEPEFHPETFDKTCIAEEGLTKKEAMKLHKALNQNKNASYRKAKIGIALGKNMLAKTD